MYIHIHISCTFAIHIFFSLLLFPGSLQLSQVQYFLSLFIVLLFLLLHITKYTQYLSFCSWIFFTHNILSFICFPIYLNYFLLIKSYSIVNKCQILFIYSLSCFHMSVIMYSSAMAIDIQSSFLSEINNSSFVLSF